MKFPSKKHRILVADIGGTNARFAGATLSGTGTETTVTIENFEAFACANHSGPADLAATYLKQVGMAKFDAACLAVAGPVEGDSAFLTNLGWSIDAKELQQELRLSSLRLVNDFAAMARSVTALGKKELLPLHKPNGTPPNGHISVMGPGTGFGAAQVVIMEDKVKILPTESGHSSFAPHGERELEIWQAVNDSLGRATVETFLSGIGLLRIYRAVCSLHGTTPRNYEPSTISQQALDGSDENCVETLQAFCSMLGGVAADVALTQGSSEVYLAGGILPKIAGFVQESLLIERFIDKPPMEKTLARIPVKLILDPEAPLKGAALLAADNWQI